jgi:SpoVK/Ycf46/Vps4 family AAA+-type ATPase
MTPPPSDEARASLPLPAAYPSAAAAVAAEVARIALVVRRALRRSHHHQPLAAANERYDLDHAERELSRLQHPAGRAPEVVDEEIDRITARIVEREAKNERDRAATTVELPLYTLARRAQLDRLAFDLFVLALAPEIDAGFARIYQLLRGGPRRQLDLATAARILTPDDPGAQTLRRELAPGGALVDLGLVVLTSADGEPLGACTLATTLSLPPSVVAYVLGQPAHDPALRMFRVADRPAMPRARTYLPDALWPHVAALVADASALPLVEGPAGSGKRMLVRTLCDEQKRPLVEIDLTSAPATFTMFEAIATARVAWLRDALLLVVLPPFDPDAPRDQRTWQRGVSDLIGRFPGRVVLCRDTAEPAHLDLGLATTRRLSPVLVDAPDREARERLWRDRLGPSVDAIDFALLARTYPITGGTITRVADEARVLGRARAGGGEAPITQADVMAALDAEFRPKLQTVGRRLTTRATHGDLVISEETRETLKELESTIRLRDQVLDDWEFRRLVRGRGVSALFYGDPGTGKTMAAGVIAASAGLPLYQIDTASLVSKWVGETEKNMSEVFRAAEAGHAMLLFDEADAIFGKRTDVQNSTDRYANMQTNFLLTQIELFNGVSILTTNRESVMDTAFQRRLTFRINFPMPEEDERDRLWRIMLAGHAEQCAQIGFAELAKRLKMSGGYIRNAVMRAAYLAAAQHVPITTELLREAAELVLRDAGKVI